MSQSPNRNPTKMWAVVLVESGIPTDVQLFTHYSRASGVEDAIRCDMRSEDDETGIFQVDVPEVVARQ